MLKYIVIKSIPHVGGKRDLVAGVVEANGAEDAMAIALSRHHDGECVVGITHPIHRDGAFHGIRAVEFIPPVPQRGVHRVVSSAWVQELEA